MGSETVTSVDGGRPMKNSSAVATNTMGSETIASVYDGRRMKKQLTVIPSDFLVTFVRAYNVHFSKYCKGRKRFVQKVPSAVCKSVYQDFISYQRLKCETAVETFDSKSL